MATTEVIIDSLPYIDTDYEEPGAKELVMAIIEEEKKRFRPTKNYLEHLPPLDLHKFETDIMKKEFERLSQRLPMESLSMKRYELPPPPTGKWTDVSAWTECVQNSYAQLEHQSIRICNLELMQEYSCEAWKCYLKVLTSMVQNSQKTLPEIKKQIQDINWQRKKAQTEAGEKLQRLNNQWAGLVSKNFEIERACMEMEMRIQELEPLVLEAEERARQAGVSLPASASNPQQSVPDTSADPQPAGPMETDNGQDNETSDEDSEESDEVPQEDFPDADKFANDPDRQ